MPTFTCTDVEFDIILAALRTVEADGFMTGTQEILTEHREELPTPEEIGDLAMRLNLG